MSDFWSGMFLLGTIVVGFFLGIATLLVMLITKKKTRLNMISFGFVFTLVSIWITDRFIAGSFCFPWECIDREIDLDILLLNNGDLPDEWVVERTFDYAYIPRASFHYRERTFHYISATTNTGFYEEIYQYRSTRGASFQFNVLRRKLPTSYSIRTVTISPQFDLQVNYASEYDLGCVFYDLKNTVCYYLARYSEYVLLLEMPFSGNLIVEDDFVGIIKLADEKTSNVLRNLVTPAP
ncbi:MAG TPA: hypothetical protein VN653_20260 [Anaerolineales bacterium]|nr:hypothetical protein [Anaerolineales bacterium]